MMTDAFKPSQMMQDFNDIIVCGVDVGEYMKMRGRLEGLEAHCATPDADTMDHLLLAKLQEALRLLAVVLKQPEKPKTPI